MYNIFIYYSRLNIYIYTLSIINSLFFSNQHLEPAPIPYAIDKKQMKKSYSRKYILLCALLLISVIAFAQAGGIKGKVTDENNQPLPGASVSIAGTTLGSTTDVNGDFIILSLKPGIYTVKVNYLGYTAQTRTVTIANAMLTINFSLALQNTKLNEVVVIGYGTQRKSDLTGSVVAVSSKDFNPGPVTTFDELITGKVSGVLITSFGGMPNTGGGILIHGGASLNASNAPLIVVDDVPIDNTAITGVADPFGMFNPNDIESITILKDASATAIYGSRASNGVIIISTKKGKGGDKLNINFNTVNSLSQITKEYSVLTAAQFRGVVQAQYPDLAPFLGDANTNWQDQIYHTAFSSDNNLSFTGGIKGLPYRLSISYLDNDGILRNDNFQRTAVALNVNHDFFNKSLKIDLNLKGTYTGTYFGNNQNAISAAVNFDPTRPVYSGSGKYGGYFEWLDSQGIPIPLAPSNPLGLVDEQVNRGTAKRGVGDLSLNYVFPFLKELQANATFGGDISDGQGHALVPATAASAFALNGNILGTDYGYFGENYSYNTDYYLKYAKDLKSINSHFDVQAGYSYQYFNTYNRSIQMYSADGLRPFNAPIPAFTGQYYIESPFGRVNFDLDHKYLLTASIRDDRSSRFGPANRNGYFPSAAIAWRIKEEPFLKDAEVLSDLKLRVSYGLTGQQDISGISSGNSAYFPYVALYEPGNAGAGYLFGNTFTTTLRADAYNPDLKWETTATTNVGLDYGFMDGKINGSIDAYYKSTTNLLTQTPVPAGANLNNIIFANVGSLVTKGVDFNVKVIALSNKDVNWTIAYNVSYNNVKLTNISLAHNPNVAIQTGFFTNQGRTIQVDKAGYAPNAFYVLQQVYDKNGKPLEGMYVDKNGDGNPYDDFYIDKQPNPAWFMGLSSNLSYKKWNCSFTMRSDLGGYIYNAVAAAGSYANIPGGGFFNNIPSSVLKTNFQQPQDFSDYFIENGSFLRMDNIALGYNFGKLTNLGTLRATINVQNVFVITKYTGLDPEIPGGADNSFYPRPRVYSLGLNLGL